jgi:hypothetical protein
MRRIFLMAFAMTVALAGPVFADTVITQWNFNSVTPDAATATGTTAPNVGSGTISVIGGATNPGFNSGSGSSDPANVAGPTNDNSGYQTETYAAQSAASGTRGVRFFMSTLGFTGINGAFDLRLSNTSSRWYQVRYTLDGTNFVNLGGPVRLGAAANAGDTWFNQNTFDLSSVAGASNNANFGFEVVSVFSPVDFTQVSGNVVYSANTAYEVARNNGSSAYAGGTWRFDMVTLNGAAVPEPSALGLLAVAGVVAGGLRRKRS